MLPICLSRSFNFYGFRSYTPGADTRPFSLIRTYGAVQGPDGIEYPPNTAGNEPGFFSRNQRQEIKGASR